ncbi:MAG: hypothetical protein L0J45_07650 [Psychroflexus sp.]|nr:hypothetical protein [Psychroflexus sp.]MDN6309150.1 hypothetical protein [Psychroflexus sp.]
MQNQPKPFSAERTQLTVAKITVFYALFFVAMKIVIIFQGAWMLPNLLISLPVILTGLAAWYLLKIHKVNWLFVIISIVVISAVRYYETEAVHWLHSYLNS